MVIRERLQHFGDKDLQSYFIIGRMNENQNGKVSVLHLGAEYIQPVFMQREERHKQIPL